MLAAAAFHAAVAATAGARLLREDRPCSGCAWKRTPDALFPPAPALPETPPKLGCWSAPSLLAGERPRAALTCEGYADPNTPACVLSLAVACVRLFAAPVEAGYVTSSALLSRPPSQRRSSQLYIGNSKCVASQQALWESELIRLIEGTSRAGEDPHTKLAHHTPHGPALRALQRAPPPPHQCTSGSPPCMSRGWSVEGAPYCQ